MKRTYQFRVYPTTQQQTTLTQWLTTCRMLYNNGLAERKDAWHTHQHSVSYYEQATQLKAAKKTNPFLKVVHSQVLQDTLRRLDKTFNNFFKRIQKGEKLDIHDLKGNTGMIPSLTRKVGSPSKRTRRNSASRKLEVSLLNYIARYLLKELSRPVP